MDVRPTRNKNAGLSAGARQRGHEPRVRAVPADFLVAVGWIVSVVLLPKYVVRIVEFQ